MVLLEMKQHTRRKRQINRKKTLTNEITQLQKELADSSDANRINLLNDKLDEKSTHLKKILNQVKWVNQAIKSKPSRI